MSKARIHQLVSEDDRVLETTATIAVIDQVGDTFLVHCLVDDGEWQRLGYDRVQQCSTYRGVMQNFVRYCFATVICGLFFDAHFHPRVQVDLLGVIRTMHLVSIGKHRSFATRIYLVASHVVDAQNHVL